MRVHVVRALVRDADKERPYAALPGVLTTEFARIRDDDRVGAVAEVMGGLEPARSYIEELLAAGKAVTTANKQLLARSDNNLIGRVRAAGSVCGAVPVIETLRVGLPAGAVTRVSGVVNGTTNFMLRRMEAGKSYDSALSEAQLLGYAEADPNDDVTGADAAAKMAIIATIAFGEKRALADVPYEEIGRESARDVLAARDRGNVLRLVGSATRDGVEVRLAELDASHPLALLEGAENAVAIEGAGFGRIVLSGPGAGGDETAAAVVADLLELLR